MDFPLEPLLNFPFSHKNNLTPESEEAIMVTMNYKFYTYTIKAESAPVGDLEGHTVGFMTRGSFYVFESGEVAMVNTIVTGDLVKGSGPFMQYATINFEDGSTIIIKSQGSIGVAAQATAGWTSEIIKGTGRF